MHEAITYQGLEGWMESEWMNSYNNLFLHSLYMSIH